MKNKSGLLVLLSGIVLLTACTNASNTAAKGADSTARDASATRGPQLKDSGAGNSGQAKDSANQFAGPAPDTADIAFLKKAASGGRLEVQLGTLSAQNGNAPRVKSFGEMMIKDHTDANLNLKVIAEQLQVMISDTLLPVHAHHKMMLSDKKGADFDKAYMTMMVEDHNEDIADFKKAINSKNPRIKNFAGQTLPVLVKHFDSAKAIVAGRFK